MILLPLLALLPLLLSFRNDFCPDDAACLQYTLCSRRAPVENPPEQNENRVEGDPDEAPDFVPDDDDDDDKKRRRMVREVDDAPPLFTEHTFRVGSRETRRGIEQVEFVNSGDPYVDSYQCYALDPIDNYRQTIHMEFRLTSEKGISVRFKTTETDIDNLIDLEFPLNGRNLRFPSKNIVFITLQYSGAIHVAIESDRGDPIVGSFSVEVEGYRPAYWHFSDSVGGPDKWTLPEFAKRLKELTPCDGTVFENDACEVPNCEPVFVDEGRNIICAGEDKKLWILFFYRFERESTWRKGNEITCKDAEWKTNGEDLTQYTRQNGKYMITCDENDPSQTTGYDSCRKDITTACVEKKYCDLIIRPQRVTCATTLQVITGPNVVNASAIECRGKRWHWQADGQPSRLLGDSKISCGAESSLHSDESSSTQTSEAQEAQTISPLTMLIGGWIGAIVVIFLAIGFCVVFVRISTRKPKKQPKTETSQGVPPSSQAAVPPPQPQ